MQVSHTNRLQADPSVVVRSARELFTLARLLSAQAAELYRELGSRMADLGNESSRAAFALIETEQRRHLEALEQRTPPELKGSPDPVKRWADLVVFDDEDLARSRVVTPYKALSVAVRNVERAFLFWTYVSAHAPDREVRAEAERLAHEELDHVHLLREARRRAYHEARRDDGDRAGRLRSMSVAAFRDEAAGREVALAELHARVCRELHLAGDQRAGILSRIAAEEGEIARSLRGDVEIAEAAEATPARPGVSFELALERLEAAAEFYLQVAETSRVEETVAEAQRLSESAVRRLAALSS
jgi:rubrerythrin